jgi:outer membrane lipoprotein-sorting protein
LAQTVELNRKNFFTSVFAVGALIAMMGLFVSCASRNSLIPESDLHSLLKTVEKKAYIVGQFQTDFHKVRTSNLFQHETHITGRLIFQKPGRFELTLTGDVNLNIFSDGSFVALIHDGQDLEFFKAQGAIDLSKFADPMMLLVNSLSNGDTSRFANLTEKKHSDATVIDIEPGALNEFESVKNVKVKFSDGGTIKLIEILFQNGNVERTYFDNWSLLTQDDPKIKRMNQSIEKLSEMALSGHSGSILQVNLQELLTASVISDVKSNQLNKRDYPQN